MACLGQSDLDATPSRSARDRGLKIQRPFRRGAIALAGLILLLAPLPAFSQSCALCYTQAASAGARMIDALRSGILILIVPPTFMSVAMIFILHSKRNDRKQTKFADESSQDW